jgi:hypothetical protein
MTAPESPWPAGAEHSMFCTECEVHRATPYTPLCPVCADVKARELRGQKP